MLKQYLRAVEVPFPVLLDMCFLQLYRSRARSKFLEIHAQAEALIWRDRRTTYQGLVDFHSLLVVDISMFLQILGSPFHLLACSESFDRWQARCNDFPCQNPLARLRKN